MHDSRTPDTGLSCPSKSPRKGIEGDGGGGGDILVLLNTCDVTGGQLTLASVRVRGEVGAHTCKKTLLSPKKKGSKKALGTGGGGTHMQKKYGISSFY